MATYRNLEGHPRTYASRWLVLTTSALGVSPRHLHDTYLLCISPFEGSSLMILLARTTWTMSVSNMGSARSSSTDLFSLREPTILTAEPTLCLIRRWGKIEPSEGGQYRPPKRQRRHTKRECRCRQSAHPQEQTAIANQPSRACREDAKCQRQGRHR